MSEATYDPFDSATEAKLPGLTYYAQVQCDAWACALVKGTGKAPFNPQTHRIEERRTAIDISLVPLAEQKTQYPLTRSMIAESVMWTKIVWPSARDLGLKSARELNGRWAKVQIVPTGRKYTKKGSTEEKDETTFKFLAFYADEAAARAAYLIGGNAPDGQPEPAAVADAGSTNGKERETALAFLKVLVPTWAAGTNDMTKVTQGIAANPVIARHFTDTSPEVIELVAAQVK